MVDAQEEHAKLKYKQCIKLMDIINETELPDHRRKLQMLSDELKNLNNNINNDLQCLQKKFTAMERRQIKTEETVEGIASRQDKTEQMFEYLRSEVQEIKQNHKKETVPRGVIEIDEEFINKVRQIGSISGSQICFTNNIDVEMPEILDWDEDHLLWDKDRDMRRIRALMFYYKPIPKEIYIARTLKIERMLQKYKLQQSTINGEIDVWSEKKEGFILVIAGGVPRPYRNVRRIGKGYFWGPRKNLHLFPSTQSLLVRTLLQLCDDI